MVHLKQQALPFGPQTPFEWQATMANSIPAAFKARDRSTRPVGSGTIASPSIPNEWLCGPTINEYWKSTHPTPKRSPYRPGWTLRGRRARNRGVEVYDSESGRCVFLAGEETANSTHVNIGGNILAVQLANGGCRWWDVTTRAGFELKWAHAMALSHGGTWLGVVTPAGAVRIINPATGKDAVAAPTHSLMYPYDCLRS